MEKRFCGVALGNILEGLRPLDELRMVAINALEETLLGDLPYQVLRDDGASAARYCLLMLGVIGRDIHYASIDGPKRLHDETPDVPLIQIRAAVAALPDGRPGGGQIGRVIASPYGTAGMLIVAQTAKGGMNCGFTRNPALDRDAAAFLLKAYFTELIGSWAGKN